jgi:hypothetical protein
MSVDWRLALSVAAGLVIAGLVTGLVSGIMGGGRA